MLTLAGHCRCQQNEPRDESKVHNNSVAEPQKILALITWNGIELGLKKRQTHAAVKDRVCADGSFWLVARRINNLRYIHTYIYKYIYVYKTLLRHLKTKQNKWKNGTP